MIFLSSFTFPSEDDEYNFFRFRTAPEFASNYPFGIFRYKNLPKLEFDHITILYGGNGSGKTTALNVIGEKLHLQRDSAYNRSSLFESYTELCNYELNTSITENSRIITSDDVFDLALGTRDLNSSIDSKRKELLEEHFEVKCGNSKITDTDDSGKLKRVKKARGLSRYEYVRKNLEDNVREYSNGENAYFYFFERLRENGLYLLDEPENSLSPKWQTEILEIIQDSAQFLGCQFVIATHSPFLLAAENAKIYDLDSQPITVKPWTELENVKIYYDFFKKHWREFE